MDDDDDFYENDTDSEDEDEDNVLGIIHPSPEGPKPTHSKPVSEPEYITSEGHKFALLDWEDDEEPTPVEDFGDAPTPHHAKPKRSPRPVADDEEEEDDDEDDYE